MCHRRFLKPVAGPWDFQLSPKCCGSVQVIKEILWTRLVFKEILWIRLVLVSARQLIKPSSSLAHSTSDFCGSTSCLHSDAQEIRRISTGAGHGYRPSAVPQELFGLSHCHASVLGQRSHSCGPRRSPRARRCYCVRRARSTYGAAEVRMTPRPDGKDVDPRRGRTPHIFRFPRASGAQLHHAPTRRLPPRRWRTPHATAGFRRAPRGLSAPESSSPLRWPMAGRPAAHRWRVVR